MTTETTRIFITGATGSPALVRSPEKASLLNNIGVKSVIGSNSDLDALASLASEADVVIAAADADDLNAAKAILRGLKEQRDKVPILIHTSGTGVLADQADGNYTTDKIYSDLDVPMIEALPRTQPHREVDLAVIAADEEGYVRTYIILPSTIYGIATTPLVSFGIQNPYSLQIPFLIKAGLARGQGGIPGKGLNVWPGVHIDDTAALYMTLFDAATKRPDETGHGRQGYYFDENGEYSVGELSQAIAKLLYEAGRGESSQATPFTDKEMEDLRMFGLASNSRARGERSKSIGWNPVHTTDSLYASLQPEVEAILAQTA